MFIVQITSKLNQIAAPAKRPPWLHSTMHPCDALVSFHTDVQDEVRNHLVFCRGGHTGRFLPFRAESKITNLLAQNPKNLLFLFRQPANFNPPSVFFLSQIQYFASTAILPGILIVPLFTIKDLSYCRLHKFLNE